MRDLALDPQTFCVSFRTQSVLLTRMEYRLFVQLLGANGELLHRQELFSRVWGSQISVEFRTVDFHMIRLRRKLQRLEDHGPAIETVWGLGYRVRGIYNFSAPPSILPARKFLMDEQIAIMEKGKNRFPL